MNSFYSEEELLSLGFKNIGKNVKLSKKSSIYNASNIEIGNNVRIDDFTILSGHIKLGNYIHIAAYSALFAGNIGIRMKDFSTISSKVTIYAISDNYSGDFMTNPTVPKEYTKVYAKRVILEKHVIVGSGSTILPGVIIKEGVAVGAMTLVNKDLKEWGIYIGVPAYFLKNRDKNLLTIEKNLLNSLNE